MTLVNQATGEVAEVITLDDVDASIDRVRHHAESIWDEWAWQVENRTWEIGDRWRSWDEMRRKVYGGMANVTAPRAERPELVSRFRAAGLTQKETAATLGIGKATVERHDTVPGARGPARNSSNEEFPLTEDVIDAELVEDDPEPLPVSASERGGGTVWSRQIQSISASIDMDALTNEELLELRGAVEYLHNYTKGAIVLRERNRA